MESGVEWSGVEWWVYEAYNELQSMNIDLVLGSYGILLKHMAFEEVEMLMALLDSCVNKS